MLRALVATPQPKNRAPFSIADACAATGGRPIGHTDDRGLTAVGVAIDSRAVSPGNLFVAIVGERFDGHDHVANAVKAGASIVVVSRDVAGTGDAVVIRVPDTVKALGGLARFHRRRWANDMRGASSPTARREVVAVTGSAGKTTSRHAIASLLQSLGRRVHSSAGNLNNAIGVPLTLLGITDDHDVAVVEIGTNARGEIAYGTSITEPDVAVVTLVAEAHTEGIGSIWDVANEKGDLFLGLRRWGTAIANGDDSLSRAQLPRSPAKRYLTYGESSDVDVRLLERAAEGIRGNRIHLEYRGARLEAVVPLLGKAGVYAALAAVSTAVALDSDVSPEALARALSAIGPSEPGRLAPSELSNGSILIDDAYNANPASMVASIQAAHEISNALGRRLVLVIGEMFELGSHTDALHERVGKAARETNAAIVAVSGKAAFFLDANDSRADRRFAASIDEARALVLATVKPGDVILVKASNSVGLGAISKALSLLSPMVQSTPPLRPSFLPAQSADEWRKALAQSKVAVVGLGKSGVAAARLAHRLGSQVIATDNAPLEKLSDAARALAADGMRVVAGGHAEASLESSDLIVISPGVPMFPELAAAANAGVPIIAELELATHLMPETPSVAITGSNGKSTTTLLVGDLLSAAGKMPFVGGNLGDPPCDIVPVPTATGTQSTPPPKLFDVWVLEISSYQAERMPSFHPLSAALLNLSPNHLDRYDGFDAYVRAKGNLFVNQTEKDLAVIPADDPLALREVSRGKARILKFGPASDPSIDLAFSAAEIIDRTREVSFSRKAIRLAGDHNALNVCAALGLVSPFNLDRDAIIDVLSRFAGLPHRIQFVREVAGIRYYDDSKGTNVGATVAAMRGLSEPKMVLIAGGRDKLGSYEPLVAALKDRGRGAVLIGEAAPRIAEAIGNIVPVVRASSMQEAVDRARASAEAGDAVLLSPACSSFDMFRDYKHRGDAFVEAVNGIPS